MSPFIPTLASLSAVGLAVMTESWKSTVFCCACLAVTLAIECTVVIRRGR
jgi:hypothetical protein